MFRQWWFCVLFAMWTFLLQSYLVLLIKDKKAKEQQKPLLASSPKEASSHLMETDKRMDFKRMDVQGVQNHEVKEMEMDLLQANSKFWNIPPTCHPESLWITECQKKSCREDLQQLPLHSFSDQIWVRLSGDEGKTETAEGPASQWERTSPNNAKTT